MAADAVAPGNSVPDAAAAHASVAASRAAYRYMDMFRLIAALVVVLNHAVDLVWVDYEQGGAGKLWTLPLYFVAGLGHHAVMVFFVLSGFWITHSAERRLGAEHFWPEYLIDRLSRLLIVIIPALVLGGTLDWLGSRGLHGIAYTGTLGAHSLSYDAAGRLSPPILAGNLSFLQGLAVPPLGSNGPLWSLAFEFWFYIWFAALLVSVRLRRLSLPLVTLGLGIIWPQLAAGFLVWLTGSAVYYLDRRASKRPASLYAAWAFTLLGAISLTAVLMLARIRWLPPQWSDLLVGVAFAVLLWGLLRGALTFPERWLAPAARYGAGASYSLYVLHYPMILFALTAAGHVQRTLPGAASAGLIAALVVLALAAAWVFSQATEANTTRLRKALRRQLQL